MSDVAITLLTLSWPISGGLVALLVNNRLQRMYPSLPPDTTGDMMTCFLGIIGGWSFVLGGGIWLLANSLRKDGQY